MTDDAARPAPRDPLRVFFERQQQRRRSEQYRQTGVPAPRRRARDVQNASVQSAPVQSAPVQNAPVQSAPVQNAPVQNAPVQNVSTIVEPPPTPPTTEQASVTAPIRFRLAALTGNERGQFVQLRTGRLRLGRDETCEIRLTDMSVSHLHAALTISEQTATIEDLGSTNHTFVNDELVEDPRDLADGDTIRLGKAQLMLEANAGDTGDH